MKNFGFAVLLSLPALGLAGCICSDVGCANTITFELATPLTSGRYEFVVDSPAGPPLYPSCIVDFSSASPYGQCPFAATYGAGNPATRLDRLVFSFSSQTRPSEVTVTVTPDGKDPKVIVHPTHFADPFSPNGEQCGPTCYSDTTEISL